MKMRCLLSFILFFSGSVAVNAQQVSYAQEIKGVVTDRETGTKLSGVRCENIFTGSNSISDSVGSFTLVLASDELIAFSKTGYKTERMRIPKGSKPSFIKVYLKKQPVPDDYLAGQRAATYQEDSARYYMLYKHVLDFPKFSTLDIIEHPFSAMSKTNQQIWAFQKEYDWYQQQKYVDYTFNEKIITSITGLNKDSVDSYLRLFRPSYEQLRAMKEYDLLNYIRQTVQMYRRGYNPRRPPSRSAD